MDGDPVRCPILRSSNPVQPQSLWLSWHQKAPSQEFHLINLRHLFLTKAKVR